MRTPLTLGLVIGASALLAGVSTATASSPDTKQMVLRLADLPAGFTLEKAYYADNRRAAKESDNQTVAQFEHWGRTAGYEADFSRSGLSGILYIASAASTYRTVKGAAASTHDSYKVEGKAQRMDRQKVVFKRVSTGGRIGHEARMFSAQVKSQGVNVIVYAVLWRYKTVKASVLVDGLDGSVDAAEVVKLARKQQQRIAAALD